MEKPNQQPNDQLKNTKKATPATTEQRGRYPDHVLDLIEATKKKGTPEQLADLMKQLEGGLKIPKPKTKKKLPPEQQSKVADYLGQFSKPPPAPPADDDNIQAIRFLNAKMGWNKGRTPDGITYESTRSIFWMYYKQIIERETGNTNPVMDGNSADVIKNFVMWLVGDPVGKYDSRKSIYMWSDLGIGKSTIAMVGHVVMSFYKSKFNWEKRYYDFRSMDELFMDTYTQQSLAGIGALATGQWCLDELREEHLTYKHYGNDVHMINDILTVRHNLWKRDGSNTIITSNIPPKDLETALDDGRLYDRIKQQYTIIKLTGENKRHIEK